MWEDLTIALCGVGFTTAAAVLLVELVALLSGAPRRRHRIHR
jgi:hypothetical protein